jgi:ABC-type multidrug transport system ATPase subunit
MTNSSSQKTVFVGGNPYIELNNQGQTIQFALTQDRHYLGRAVDVDLQIPEDWIAVSRYHATLVRHGEDYYIYDGKSDRATHQPSRNGLLAGQTRVGVSQGYPLHNGITLQIGQNPQTLVSLKYINPNAPQPAQVSTVSSKSVSLSNRSVLLGRDPNANLVLDAPTVSRRHATIDADPNGGYRLVDLSTNGVFVNGQKVNHSIYLSDNSTIRIGPFVLLMQGDRLIVQDRGDRLRVDAVDISRIVGKDRKYLLNQVSLPLEPGQLVALVGGSGTGKSTLLRTLLGIEPISEGQVYLNGENLRQNFNMYRTQIGYVPQDDIVHRNLTVAQVLTFAAKLRLPPDTDIESVLTQTLKDVELSDRRDTLVKNLSGGQRKRVSIAVELLADPKLFFLDEPTSGLDPGLDKKMMQMLQRLAHEENRTVVLVTHATANITLCDRVAFMGRGGNLCYFGPPPNAPTFFGVQQNDFAEIYNELEKPPEENNGTSIEEHCCRWRSHFQNHTECQQYVSNQLIAQNQNTSNFSQTGNGASPSPQAVKPSIFKQLYVLLERDLRLVFADRFNFGLSLLTAPIGIALITLAISDRNPLVASDEPDPTLAPLALRVLFVFTCAAIWVGLSGSLQTIVREAAIYMRERLVNLGLFPYFVSKVTVLSFLAIVQTLLIAIVVLIGFQSPEPDLFPWWLGLSITTLLTLITSGCLGLAISSFVYNETQANTALPLLLLPQIIFSGVLFDMEGPARLLSWFMLSRWSVGAYGALVDVNAMVPEPVKYPDGSTVPQPFEATPVYDPTWENLSLNWAILGLHAIVYSIAVLWRQKQKDIL